MNTKRVNAAAGVIHAAQVKGKQTATGLAADLEAACMLQSPETAAELAAYRALELGTPEGRVSAKCEDPKHPVWLRELDDVRGCPWCRVAELETELEKYVGKEPTVAEEMAYLSRCFHAVGALTLPEKLKVDSIAPEYRNGYVHALADMRTALELPDAITRRIAPTQALREDEPPLHGRALLDALTVERAERAHKQRLGIEDPHDSPLHHGYRLGRDLPQPDAAP